MEEKEPIILTHPLLQDKMAKLRNVNTGSQEFRAIVREISSLMCYEATRDLSTQEVEVQTPCGIAQCQELAGKKMALVPILRAGLGMVDGMLSLVPSAKIGHIGMYRDHETLQPVEYFCKLPKDIGEREVFVLDPMLATGWTAVDAITLIKEKGAKHIRIICIVSAPEGMAVLRREHPDVQIYTVALDEKLNDEGYIVPGLGDAGDRIFGTF